MFIKKKLKHFTILKQISPDLSGVSGDFQIVCVIISLASEIIIDTGIFITYRLFKLTKCFVKKKYAPSGNKSDKAIFNMKV